MTAARTRKAPQDRKAKLPRTVKVPILLDDELGQELEEAEQALLEAEQREEAKRERYVGEARRTALPVASNTDPAQFERVAQERIDQALAPFRQRVDEVKAEVEKATQWYVFRSIGRDAYRDLQDAHPPTDEDHKELADSGEGGKATFHLDTFAPALVQASCVEPVLDNDAIEEIFHGIWNESEITQLFIAAQTANISRRVVDLGKARR